MREILDAVDRWREAGLDVAVARVVGVVGSGPRAPGAAMAVSSEGEVAGSVSGGCVEGAVVTEALAVLEAGGAGRTVSFGYSDDEAFAVGLTCGGTVHLYIEGLSPLFEDLAVSVRAEEPAALVTVTDGPGRGGALLVRPGREPEGSLGDSELDRIVARDALGELAAGRTGIRHYGEHGEARAAAVTVFVQAFAPPPQMIIFGAVDFTAALAGVAKVLGYRITVCDAREVFATPTRFRQADEVVVDWPDRLLARIGPALTPRDAICVLTHDSKFDVPALLAALKTEAGYVGAMGSRRTHEERLAHLVDAGVDAEGLARIRSPIGLDLGARTPEETAVSICAEIIADRTGRTDARPLRETSGPLH